MSATPLGNTGAAADLADAIQVAPSVGPDPQGSDPIEDWVQSLQFWQFYLLTPEQIIYLTPAQVATIPNADSFDDIAAASRAAMTEPQIKALNTATISISLITDAQVHWLTTLQIQALPNWDFKELYDYQIPSLTTTQIGTIQNSSILPSWTPEARAALTPAQVQSLNVDVTGINPLTDDQVAVLTEPQVRTLKFYEFYRLTPTQIPYLTAAQIATIQNSSILPTWSVAARAALTATQIQALNVNITGINLLTDAQVAALSPAQVQTLKFYEFYRLTPTQIPHLTTTQIGTIQSTSILPMWSAAARAALTSTQIQALNVGVTGVNLLTDVQVAALNTAQVRTLKFYEFFRLTPAQIPWLTTAQIGTIQTGDILPSWTAAARAALTAEQIVVLNVNVLGISLLTPSQIAALSLSQLHTLKYYEFKLLNATQIPQLLISQIASIPNSDAFDEMDATLRAALTAAQVNALNVANVRINLLTSQQIGWLTTAQVQSLPFYDFGYLSPSQIPLLTTQQFASIPNSSVLNDLSDEAQMAITREQMLSLPLSVYAVYVRIPDYTPPASYIPTVQIPIGPDGLPSAAHLTAEADRFFALVPIAAATNVAVANGNWSSPQTWSNGVPAVGAKVYIPAGKSVTFDAFMDVAIDTLRIDGTLTFAVDRNTQMKVDTIVVHTAGTLHIGTAANPIQDHVSARIVITNGTPINAAWDPYLLSRGLLSRGEVRMYGKQVKPFVELSVAPVRGDTVLHLSEIPANWQVGDQLVIAGTMTIPGFGTDRLTILAINGTSVTVDPLLYSHVPPDGYDFKVHVANVTRNVNFVAQTTSATVDRPHMVFFHNRNVQIDNINVTGFGRTDKNIELNDPVVVNGVRVAGTGTNPRARYPIHFHHTSVNPTLTPATVRGSVVIDSPGWGYVNHSSNVVMEDNIALDVLGASFTTEDGNEIGAMRRNLSMNNRGAAGESDIYRYYNHDFGFLGNGFWFQGPGVEVVDNIAAGSHGAGFIYITLSSKNMFDAVNLDNPAMAGGKTVVPVGSVPLKTFKGNTSYATYIGLDIWDSMRMMNDGESVIEDFTAWNTHIGIELNYSAHIHIKNSTVVGYLDSFQGVGLDTNWWVQDLTVTNLRVAGYEVGIDVPVRRSTTINGADIAAVKALYIEKAHDTTRTVHINGPINIATLTPAQLDDRVAYKVYATGSFATEGADERNYMSMFSDDTVMIALDGDAPVPVYYVEQAADYIPFPVGTPTDFVPSQYIGKRNSELQQLYGLAFNGAFTPPGAVMPTSWHAYTLGLPSQANADFDGDSDADGFDFLAWQRGFGMTAPTATKPDGDSDGDHDVDAADLAIWRADFGSRYAASANLTIDDSPANVQEATDAAFDEGDFAAPLTAPNVDVFAASLAAGDDLQSFSIRRPRWRHRN